MHAVHTPQCFQRSSLRGFSGSNAHLCSAHLTHFPGNGHQASKCRLLLPANDFSDFCLFSSKFWVICPKANKCTFFLHFSMILSKKNSSGRRSDNIDASGLPNSSFESLCPKVVMEHVKNAETLKIGGPSPLQSQLIRNCDTQKTCFGGSFLEKILVLTNFDQRKTPP